MKIRKLFGTFFINLMQIMLSVFALSMIWQIGIYILGGESIVQAVVVSFLTASFISIPTAFQLCFPLFLYSLIKKTDLPVLKNKSILAVIPVSYLFIGNISYSLYKFWELFENSDFLSIYVNLIIFNFLFIALTFEVLKFLKLRFRFFSIPNTLKILGILLLIYLFLSPLFIGPQLDIFASNTKVFNDKVASFSLTPEKAYKIVYDWTEKSDNPPMHSINNPRYIIDDYYYYPPLRKLEGPLIGYYVNGNTGKLEFRDSDHIIKGSFLGVKHKKIPANIFDTIEILAPGKLENK